MRARKQVCGWAAAILVGTGIVACGGGGGDASGVAPTARATIGAAGGTVASADGRVALTIPAGALGNATEIRITELAAAEQPASVRAASPLRVYRLEPSGTQFAVPARLRVELPPSAAGEIAVMALHSNGTYEAAADMALSFGPAGRVISGDVPHFSEAVIGQVDSVRATLVTDRPSTTVGTSVEATYTVVKSSSPESFQFYPGNFNTSTDPEDFDEPAPELSVAAGSDLQQTVFGANEAKTLAESRPVRCVGIGGGYVIHTGLLEDFNAFFGLMGPSRIRIETHAWVECTGIGSPPPGPAVAAGLFNIPGLTAFDGINFLPGPFAGLASTALLATVAGAEGAKVRDLSTRQDVLDRTAAGPDGATLGTNLLGAVAVAQAASAGAPAAMIGFDSAGASVQNWNAATGWGATVRDFKPTFDVVTAGGGTVASTVALVRAVAGVEFLTFDATAGSFRIDPTRSLPYASFPGIVNLTSAQLVSAMNGDLLVLGRGGASVSTSTKVFYKNVDDLQPAATLLSLGSADARRLRCIPVGTKQACVATVFSTGEGKAFLFDPASPRDTPAVTTLVAAAGTLGVAQAVLTNGRIAVAMANFSANSLTVAELSPDLATVHSRTDIPAPAGCTGTAHVALLTDSEGLKAVVTCNGTSNYWVVKPFG